MDVRSADLRSVWIVNNIVFDNFAYEIATFAPRETRQQTLAEKGVVIAGNLTGPFRDEETRGGPNPQFPRPYPFEGEKTIEGNPRFVFPRAADFRLRPGSPAIGAATRFEGVPFSPDLGAFGSAHD